MQSHLTALVFRQILRNRPLTHKQCVRLLETTQWALKPSCSSSIIATRSLFSWGSRKTAQLAKAKRIDPGYTELARLDELLRMNVRPLDADVVNKALEAFFSHKHRSRSRVTDNQVHLALVACRFLLANGQQGLTIEGKALVPALKSLQLRTGNNALEKTVELASILYAKIEESRNSPEFEKSEKKFAIEAVLPYIEILCSCRKGKEARMILDDALRNDPDTFSDANFWEPVLNVFIAEKDDVEMTNTLKMMEEHGVPLGQDLQLSVLNAFVLQNDFPAAQQWHNALVAGFPSQSQEADSVFLKLCIKQQKLKEGEAAFKRLVEHEPSKTTWDLILQWAAAKKKGVDEVERMMDVMVKRNKAANVHDRPDIETINGLIALANSIRDPYQAERFVALAEKRGIYLNGKSYVLQMEYRLNVGDLAGAFKAFQQMLSHEVDDASDLPQINCLIQRLCAESEPENDQIGELLRAIDDRRVPYDPQTIVALCELRLRENHIRSLINLLHTHAYNLSQDQRRPIMQVFLRYILDRKNSAKASWDAYCILREIFKELGNEERTKIMIEFFARGRSDVAVHVFGHMRQTQIMEDRPSTDTYALCFQGVGHAADERSFDLVYNMLKLDSEIEPDTRLRNAIMLAQIGCGFRTRALEVWDDIVFSREGPTYNSIAIALYAVETTDSLTDKGQEIWERLEKYGVQPTRQIYTGYIGALAGQDKLAEAMLKVECMEEVIAEPPDATTLGVLYNAAFTSQRDEVKKWARARFPKLWAQLELLDTTEHGLYKINRQLTP